MAVITKWLPWIFPLGVIVSGLFFPFPVAILLYWLTNNVWTLAQQWLVHRSERGPVPVTLPAAARIRGPKPVR